ncbi:SET domain-containing protein [Lachnellula suecica]|uniref:SET domain-containing protein n=1 Tax=Lachnellula suecica TaxID=602035 RepID=A0A8T9CIK3_9HELO|nr:SET domain-containing protein [Lachnellula suecica]
MTERPLSITTQIATPIQTTFNSAASISATDALPVAESVDEEPYTIKCICDYLDDDGNTIYCESCDTWQHIECFYPGQVADASREEFDHSCADCKPRTLDKRHATERQRHQRQNKASNDNGDKKTKRPPSKSHKKKKPAELQVNGLHHHDGHRNGSPQEHHSHSKKKGHRSSQSISQLKRSPPFNSRPNTHTHPPSPAHTPPDLPNELHVHDYSDSFRKLYDHEAEVIEENLFENLSVTNTWVAWLRDPATLYTDTGKNHADHFQQLTVEINTLQWPDLRVEEKRVTMDNKPLLWKQLTTPDALKQAGRIGVLYGRLGFQSAYCESAENGWAEIPHPRPFFFFHPTLPVVIDTRDKGSKCRYARRSCRPNTLLETFIGKRRDPETKAHATDAEFWLVSERPLTEGEQITVPWDFRFPSNVASRYLHALNLNDEDGAPFEGESINDEEYMQLSQMIFVVLSDHGGCACDLGNDCAFVRFHRNFHPRTHAQSNGVKSKKGRKPKQNHVSPTSTGHATNSRAASEGQQDHCDEDDSRSISGSSRSKPHSRDLTPLHGIGETNGVTTGPTEREKRKIQMVEDSFKKLDQPPRKKKRASDGSTINSATNSATSQPAPKPRQRSVVPRQPPTINSSNGRLKQYVDASTSRRQSGSPFSAVSPTAVLPSPKNHASRAGSATYQSRQSSTDFRGPYVDSSTQTEDSEDAWWKQPTAKPTRTIVPLSRRLLNNRQRIKALQQARQSEQPELAQFPGDSNVQLSPVVAMDIDIPVRSSPDSPVDFKGRNPSIASSTPSVEVSDVVMADAPAITISNPIRPPPPWSGHPNNANGSHPSGPRSPELRVQMPPTPTFAAPNMSGALSGSITPSAAAGPMAQSPFGTVHFPNAFPPSVNGIGQHPSPVRTTKKMSLSDYKAARMKKNDTSHASNSNGGSSPTAAPPVLRPSLSTVEEAKASGLLEGSAIVDSPMAEKTVDPMSSAPITTSIPEDAARNSLPSESEWTNGTL